jgi:hypothetical protein
MNTRQVQNSETQGPSTALGFAALLSGLQYWAMYKSNT